MVKVKITKIEKGKLYGFLEGYFVYVEDDNGKVYKSLWEVDEDGWHEFADNPMPYDIYKEVREILNSGYKL